MGNCWMCWMMVPIGMFGLLVVIGMVALVMFAIVKAARSSNSSAQAPEPALATLERRYARGEISAEQFEAIKQRLSEGDETRGS